MGDSDFILIGGLLIVGFLMMGGSSSSTSTGTSSSKSDDYEMASPMLVDSDLPPIPPDDQKKVDDLLQKLREDFLKHYAQLFDRMGELKLQFTGLQNEWNILREKN